MTFTKWVTETHSTAQKSGRNGAVVDFIVIHHAATLSADVVINMEVSGSRQVSSGLVVKDARIAGVVPEEYRAWSLSDAAWDARSHTVETCNETGAPSWTISEASYLSLARVVADWCARYGIPCNRSRIIGHREVYTIHGGSYATACPGGIDLDRVVAMAKAILTPAPLEEPMEDEVFQYIWTDEVTKEYAIVGDTIENGHKRTTDLATAEAYSVLSPTGAPRKCTRKQFEATITLGKTLAAERAKLTGGGSVTLPDPKAWGEAAAAAFSAKLPTLSGSFK